MYHILELTNGQPMILWQSGNTLQKYVIRSGRVYNAGTMLKDINQHFQLWNTTPAFASYESVDGATVICRINADNTEEVFIGKGKTVLFNYHHKLCAFFLEPCDDTYTLYVSTSDNFAERKMVCDKLDLSESLYVTQNQEFIILMLKEKQLFLSADFQVMMTMNLSASKNTTTANLQNEVSQLKFELHQLEQHHSDFVKEYEQLSAYTGELQEKLRKTRLNVN